MNMITLKDVFKEIDKTGNWYHPMHSFMHWYMIDFDFNEELVKDEPICYPSIDQEIYIFAACFVHYWCSVMLKEIPEWVLKDIYKFKEPHYMGIKSEELEKITPWESEADRELSVMGQQLEIHISGGANLCIYNTTRRSTHDIDTYTKDDETLNQLRDRRLSGVISSAN